MNPAHWQLSFISGHSLKHPHWPVKATVKHSQRCITHSLEAFDVQTLASEHRLSDAAELAGPGCWAHSTGSAAMLPSPTPSRI